MIKKIKISEVGTLGIRGGTVLLDVDGTIVADRMEDIAPADLEALFQLAKSNSVYLCTNAKDPDRIVRLSKRLGVSYAPVPADKPGIAFLKDIPMSEPVVIIGDKVLTDYIVGKKIGARIILVERKTGPNDPFHTKAGYVADDISFFFLNVFSGLEERHKILMKVARFILSGGTAAALDLVLLFVLTSVFHIWYLLSAVIAFVFAFVVSFTLQKYWTFRDGSKDKIPLQAAAYFLIAVMNLCVNTVLVYTFVEHAHIHYLVSQIISSALLAVESYFLYQTLVFKRQDLK
jgi:putative flippase GtrA/predicted HAD superfamily phosphohydrolase YqeG